MRWLLAIVAGIGAIVLGVALSGAPTLDVEDPEPRSADTPTTTATAEPTPERKREPAGKPGQEQSGRLPAGPLRIARRFLAAYLPWQYGELRAGRRMRRWATPRLVERLEEAPVRVPADVARRRKQVRIRSMVAAEPFERERRGAIALVEDGRRSLSIELELTRRGGGWLVSSVGGL
jgi:hypothetical protein